MLCLLHHLLADIHLIYVMPTCSSPFPTSDLSNMTKKIANKAIKINKKISLKNFLALLSLTNT